MKLVSNFLLAAANLSLNSATFFLYSVGSKLTGGGDQYRYDTWLCEDVPRDPGAVLSSMYCNIFDASSSISRTALLANVPGSTTPTYSCNWTKKSSSLSSDLTAS